MQHQQLQHQQHQHQHQNQLPRPQKLDLEKMNDHPPPPPPPPPPPQDHDTLGTSSPQDHGTLGTSSPRLFNCAIPVQSFIPSTLPRHCPFPTIPSLFGTLRTSSSSHMRHQDCDINLSVKGDMGVLLPLTALTAHQHQILNIPKESPPSASRGLPLSGVEPTMMTHPPTTSGSMNLPNNTGSNVSETVSSNWLGACWSASGLEEDLLELSSKMLRSYVVKASRFPLYLTFRMWAALARYERVYILMIVLSIVLQFKHKRLLACTYIVCIS
jgi:hypothetical protein